MVAPVVMYFADKESMSGYINLRPYTTPTPIIIWTRAMKGRYSFMFSSCHLIISR